MRELLRRFLCSLGFHQPGGLVFTDVTTNEHVMRCKRLSCRGVYHEDFVKDDWRSA